ncbi:MAG TPA: alginate export family protein [Terriglobales bacterium]|nr:alginate export family protein [Terriglobales bacterium]
MSVPPKTKKGGAPWSVRLRVILALFCLVAAGAAPGVAQISDELFPDSSDAPQPLKIGSLTIGGEVLGRGEYWNWFFGNTRTHYAFGQSLLRLDLSQQGTKYGWTISVAQPSLYHLPSNAFVPGTNTPLGYGPVYFVANGRETTTANAFVQEAYVSIRGIDRNHSTVRVGRFLFNEGLEKKPESADLAWLVRERISQRLVGDSEWTGITRSFDGAHFSSDLGPDSNVTLMAARVTRGVFKTDALGEMDVETFYGAYTREFVTPHTDSELRVFGLGYYDGRNVLKADNRPLAARVADTNTINVGTFGVNYALVAPIRYAGKWDLVVWGAEQIGHWGSLTQRANSGLFELGWHPPIPKIRPWLRAGAFFASGDGNPNDGKHATFFQPLPTEQLYARVPFYTLQNTEDYTGQVIFQPNPRLELRSEVHKVKLHAVNDEWYLGTGAFQNTTFGYYILPSGGHRGLGNYVDFSANYQVNAHLALHAYVGAMSGKAVETSSLKGKKGGFTFLEVAYRF